MHYRLSLSPYAVLILALILLLFYPNERVGKFDSALSSYLYGLCPVSLSCCCLRSCYFISYTYPITMSSYDPIPVDGIITQEQFKASMKLVRLQIAVPISVLASISANIVCALAIKPGLRRFSVYLSRGLLMVKPVSMLSTRH
jgi:hypothetical protein